MGGADLSTILKDGKRHIKTIYLTLYRHALYAVFSQGSNATVVLGFVDISFLTRWRCNVLEERHPASVEGASRGELHQNVDIYMWRNVFSHAG